MKGSLDAHSLTSEKLRCMSHYVMRIENEMKSYKLGKKQLDTMIDEHFVSPLVDHNMRNKLSMKKFKQFAAELYEKMTETE
jgi:hypothetical protein